MVGANASSRFFLLLASIGFLSLSNRVGGLADGDTVDTLERSMLLPVVRCGLGEVPDGVKVLAVGLSEKDGALTFSFVPVVGLKGPSPEGIAGPVGIRASPDAGGNGPERW